LLPPGDVPFRVEGANAQVITVNIAPGQKVVSEPGAMLFMHPQVEVKAECAPGACQRCCCLQESCFQLIYNTEANTEGAYVGMTPSFPAKVVAMDLPQVGEMVIKNGAYMGHIGDVDLGLNCDCCSKTCCCGGLGCVRQNIGGSGTAFIAAGGTIMEKELADHEEIKIDPDSLVGYSKSMNFTIEFAGCCGCCCGGEGFYAVLKGPGKVFMQSMSFESYALAVNPPPPPKSGGGE